MRELKRVVEVELGGAPWSERDGVRLVIRRPRRPDRDAVATSVTLESCCVPDSERVVVDEVTGEMLVVHPRQRAEGGVCGQRLIWPTRPLHWPSGQRGDRVTGDAKHRRVLGLPAGPCVTRRRAHAANGEVVPGVDPRRVGDGEGDTVTT